MKLLFTILMIMTTATSMAQDGKAVTTKKTFSRATKVSIEINSDASIIWALLTNASDFPRWNSTILSIEGEIEVGTKIKLVSYLDPKRTFKIKIKEIVLDKKMIWGDGMGNRVFTLEKSANGGTIFTMDEKIGNPMFPLFANKIPPFDESFEKYAADLKKEAELIANQK
jgi:hypothetical protein